MAPFSLMIARVSLAKSFSVFCTSALARCTGVLPATYITPVKCLTSQANGRPKRPLTGYMTYVVQQQPIVIRQNPEIKRVDVIKMIAQQWRTMSPEQKQPFQEASLQAREKFKLDLQNYQSQLTPEQVKQEALDRQQKMDRRKIIRKKRDATKLGKPKRARTAFNIFMSENYEEAKGTSTQSKLKSLTDDWRNLFAHQKKVYTELAEDDKIRYSNEMTLWEKHMVEIGREDLLREETRSVKKKTAAAKAAAKKKAAAAKAAAKKKTAAAKAAAKKGKGKKGDKSKVVKKTTKSSSEKTKTGSSTESTGENSGSGQLKSSDDPGL